VSSTKGQATLLRLHLGQQINCPAGPLRVMSIADRSGTGSRSRARDRVRLAAPWAVSSPCTAIMSRPSGPSDTFQSATVARGRFFTGRRPRKEAALPPLRPPRRAYADGVSASARLCERHNFRRPYARCVPQSTTHGGSDPWNRRGRADEPTASWLPPFSAARSRPLGRPIGTGFQPRYPRILGIAPT